jgi:hypothetical protein
LRLAPELRDIGSERNGGKNEEDAQEKKKK